MNKRSLFALGPVAAALVIAGCGGGGGGGASTSAYGSAPQSPQKTTAAATTVDPHDVTALTACIDLVVEHVQGRAG